MNKPIKSSKPSKLARRPGIQGARADVIAFSHDTALRLLHDIKSKRIDPKDLTPQQRRSCLVLMANGKQTSAEMAATLGTTAKTIRTDLQVIRLELGREIATWTLEEVLGQLYMAKEKCAAQAMRNEDPGLAWTVERDWAKMLKELGVIGARDEHAGVRLTVEAIGVGMERAVDLLSKRLDPALTGEVIQARTLTIKPGEHAADQESDHASMPVQASLPSAGDELGEDDDEDDHDDELDQDEAYELDLPESLTGELEVPEA